MITPCCALIDLHMPGMKGVDVVLRTSAEMTNIPAVIITGFDQPGMRQKCLEAGAANSQLKPLDGSAVLEAVRQAVAPSRNQ
jgi:FixJ family two-component response regulator